MKKFLMVLIIISAGAALLIPLVLKKNPIPSANTEIPETTNLYERPKEPLVITDSAIVKIVDIKDAEISFYTYDSKCNGYETLNYCTGSLPGIFTGQKVLPIEKNSGLFALYFIDEIDEYFFDGKSVSILLKDGNLINGLPVNDYEISGKCQFGDISVRMGSIKYAKFNKKISNNNLQDSKELLKQYSYLSGSSFTWPDDFKESIEINTSNDNTEVLSKPIFVYNKSGCDDNWIPCKSYNVWLLSNFIPVVNGTFTIKINIQQIKTADIAIKQENNVNDYFLNLTLNNNETLKNTHLYNGKDGFESDYCYTVGILGFIDHGVALMPINRLKQIKKK